MSARLIVPAVLTALLAVPVAVSADDKRLDHPAPSFSADAPLATGLNSGGEGATWERIATFPTGNPHTDLDFFTQGGETFLSAGTLAAGPNGGGQTVLQLTEEGEVAPRFVSSHPSAECPSNPVNALGLQHDVEATPKGSALLNTAVPRASRGDTQLLIDASDADGRCHDGGLYGLSGAPQGGLEIVDVTDPSAPKEIGLTSHIGEAHTVNVDPRRPHIAYAATSDAVSINAAGQRENEIEGDNDASDLDGFEVVDLSSCMNFPEGTTITQKRDACRPEVYRYRYPSKDIALGHTLKNAIYGCHELEVYPDDRLTCGSGAAAILFDMSGAFDDNGTPRDFTDDKPRGTPLPCRVRESTSTVPFETGAMVTDCVVGQDPGGGAVDLKVPNWLKIGAPSLEGVEYLGSAHHMGRGAGTQPSSEDIDFDHEAELTDSRRFIIATDERGGGVTPPGATCSPAVDNPEGNGGLHAYAVDRLDTSLPGSAEEAFDAYARTPEGDKAIHRVPVRTQPEGTFCTAHVFQQIPGQNRIFMGWYSQGTQVIDFTEHPDGTIEFEDAGWFIPENANTWTSAIFKMQANDDDTFTYWGATGDFNLGTAGRSAIDVYKVTLPAPPEPARRTGTDRRP